MIQNSAACPPLVTDHAQWSVASAKEGEMSRRDEKEGTGKEGRREKKEGKEAEGLTKEVISGHC